MASNVQDQMTHEEILNNYEFKIAKRMLKQDYPWVKDVFIKRPEENNKYNIIFIDIMMDPYLLGREKDWNVSPYVNHMIKKGGEYWSPYISSFFTNASYEDAKPIMQELDKKLEALHKSPALPTDLRLPEARKLAIGAYYADLSSSTPEDTTNSLD
jgi:hypothetical protein